MSPHKKNLWSRKYAAYLDSDRIADTYGDNWNDGDPLPVDEFIRLSCERGAPLADDDEDGPPIMSVSGWDD